MSLTQKMSDLASQLSPQHWEALRRLAASTRTSQFPLDVGMYRDLIKLELIVDSGRELRVTKLGLELLHHHDRPEEMQH